LKYHHLSLEERVELYACLKKGEKLTHIAERLGRETSTLSRELSRHTRYGRTYKPVLANKRAATWANRQRYRAPLKNPETLAYVLEKIKLGWSPETIEGRIGIDHPGLSVSYETIYQWIYYHKQWKKDHLWKYLDCGHIKRRQKRGRQVHSYTQVLDSKSIDLRPDSANLRLTVGHGESDLMESNRESSAALSVTVDRLTRMTSLVKILNKSGFSKAKAILKPNKFLFKWETITTDRGSENKSYQKWEQKLGIAVYFCHSYHSWEKGTVEHTIRGVRKFIPKGEDVNNYSWRDVQRIEEWINHKPLKVLQYLTPYEKMLQVTQNLKLGE
jgi:transposase, IS30 family